MPKREDIKKIMIIGSGPIVIGQACEFDYSGTQACKALKEEGYEVILVNSNPATIMTDPNFADRTYIEPLNKDVLHEIIRRERPDALLPTLGGQTGLNLSLELFDAGILSRYHVELIGADSEAIRRAEDRDLFKKTMQDIGLDVPVSRIAHTLEEAKQAAKEIGRFPLIIRPGFTLGGTGGGIAYDDADLVKIVTRGLNASMTSEVLIEESLLGWGEFEVECMRDRKDNNVIVCTIENIDPMGVHTGDSITIAPTLSVSREFIDRMCKASIEVMRAIGINSSGSNIQWAYNPQDGRMAIIEMNPRVSRSSALASKATGFPIAKFAAKLAIGYTLDEMVADLKGKEKATFELSIDYIVTKVPRFAFEKFPTADSTLTTQMKSVGETMSLGKTFKESLQKALRSLETGRSGFGADGKDGKYAEVDDEFLAAEIKRPNKDRLYYVREALKRGWSIEKLYDLSKIDHYFLREFKELTDFEEKIKEAGSLENLKNAPAFFREIKKMGYSDKQIAFLTKSNEADVFAARKAIGLLPSFEKVEACAGRIASYTPYYYSTYGLEAKTAPKADKKKIMILGGGPNRIGQGIEFDYCCVHASFALRGAGFETVMVNSNPETVSTDYDTSDRLFFEPLTLEDVLHVYQYEQCDGAIVQFGGQTPLKLAQKLEDNGVNIIGTTPAYINAAEDRKLFNDLVGHLDIRQPEGGTATNVEGAVAVAERLGYPVLVRPSFVLGGRAMVIVYDENSLRKYMAEAVEASEDRPILVDKYLENATELDVDCVSDGVDHVIGAIMEHVELAGIHSGDSACMIPTMHLRQEVLEKIRKDTHSLAEALHVKGLMNVQFAVQNNEVYVLEVNPRASRTVPFVSKATGVPLAKIASLVMVGRTLKEIGFTREVTPDHFCVKEAVFPFVRFPGVDIVLSPEMKSTGEVMGIDMSEGLAYLKTQIAAGNSIPTGGGDIFLSVRKLDRNDIVPLAKDLIGLGFHIHATCGTATTLAEAGIKVSPIFKISEGRPNVIDAINDKELKWIINTPSTGVTPKIDEIRMRAHAITKGVPITTTIAGVRAAIDGIKEMRRMGRMEVCSIQEYHKHIPMLCLK